MSPEGWDTLLTTLTPDPQPPSASSSFVSTAASQSAGASSNTSLSGPLQPAESAPEPPCEPGLEDSDGEDENDIRRGPPARGLPRALHPGRLYLTYSSSSGSDDPDGQQRASETSNNRSNHVRPLEDIPGLSAQSSGRNAWVSVRSLPPMSISPSRGHREGSATSGNNGTSADEELSGWQRIVRGLANRDDIPDEWWAEAGLSRTLGRD